MRFGENCIKNIFMDTFSRFDILSDDGTIWCISRVRNNQSHRSAHQIKDNKNTDVMLLKLFFGHFNSLRVTEHNMKK